MDDVRVFVVRTTNSCNLNCSYCYVQGKGAIKIDIELVKRLIAQSAAMAENTIVFFWHGGEPLLMGLRFFEDIVKFQKQFDKQFVNAVQTNGIGLHQRHIEFFKENSFRLGVSLDLLRDQHNANRKLKDGKTGSFDLVVKKLEMLAEHDMPVGVLGVVTDLTLDVDAYVDIIDNYSIDDLALNLEFNLARRSDATAAAQYTKLLHRIYRYAAHTDRAFKFREIETVIQYVRRRPASYCQNQPRFCGYTNNAVAENGDIYICCDKFIDSPWSYAKLGNIRTDNLVEIFASKRFRELMRTLSGTRLHCTTTCPIGGFCQGGCIHDVLSTPGAGSRRREQVGCVARTALFHTIDEDFHAAPRPHA